MACGTKHIMSHYGIEPISDTVVGMLPTMIGVILAAGAWLYCCRRLVGPGIAADRLWLRSMAAVAVTFALYLGAHWIGVTPASQAEREFVAMVIQAGEDAPAIRSQTKALAAVMQSDYYVSRRLFMLAEHISKQL